MKKIISVILLVALTVCVSACKKRDFPVGKIEAPKDAPQYTVTPELTKSK